MSEAKGKYTCEACGASFYLHEDLVRHNANAHGAAIGTQLRQSEEIKKQREREQGKGVLRGAKGLAVFQANIAVKLAADKASSYCIKVKH